MKKILTLGLIGVLTLSMLGCTPTPKGEVEIRVDDTSVTNNDSNTADHATEDYYVSPTDDLAIGDVITVGDIMMFDGDRIHIISGDLVEVFEYDNQNEKDFYIGQTVQLKKDETVNVLSHFEQEDYTISHTNMGHMINQITGTLVAVNKESITIENEKGQFEIKTYEEAYGSIGDKVTAYVMSFDERLSSIMLINENSKLELSITAISRTEDGAMELTLIDADAGEYVINPSHLTVEFDIATLKVDDVLTVYHKGIMESWPMQLDTILIRK